MAPPPAPPKLCYPVIQLQCHEEQSRDAGDQHKQPISDDEVIHVWKACVRCYDSNCPGLKHHPVGNYQLTLRWPFKCYKCEDAFKRNRIKAKLNGFKYVLHLDDREKEPRPIPKLNKEWLEILALEWGKSADELWTNMEKARGEKKKWVKAMKGLNRKAETNEAYDVEDLRTCQGPTFNYDGWIERAEWLADMAREAHRDLKDMVETLNRDRERQKRKDLLKDARNKKVEAKLNGISGYLMAHRRRFYPSSNQQSQSGTGGGNAQVPQPGGGGGSGSYYVGGGSSSYTGGGGSSSYYSSGGSSSGSRRGGR
ncbi:hypothetical protein V8F33_009090 [Rhypophila sp. PSN 637]